MDEPGHTYLWNTGETTQTIEITEIGIYTVNITSENGCISTAEIFVGPPYEADLGGDRSICQDESLRLNATGNANEYRWFVNDNLQAATGQNFNVDTSVPGTFLIRVEIPDPLDPNCYAEDEIEVIVNESPNISVDNTVNPSCNTPDGSITISTSGGSGDFNITWSGPTAVPDNQLTGNNLLAGTYNITVTDNLSGCSTVETVSLTNTDFTVTVNQTTTDCTPNNQSIEVNLTGNPGPLAPAFNWEIIDQNSAITQSGTETSTPFNVNNLSEGSYSIEVTDNNGCVGTIPFDITLPDSVDFNPDDNVFGCGSEYDLQAYLSNLNSNAVFNITPEPADRTAVPAGSYEVEATETGRCSSTATINVQLSPQANILEIENVVDCDGGNQLTAVLDGQNPEDFTFTWSNGAQGQSITVNQAGTYSVRVNPRGNTSCGAELPINVDEIYVAVETSLVSETNCEDGTILLIGSISGGSGNFNYSLTNAQGTNIPTVDPTSNILEWNITESSTYTFTVNDNGPGGCDPVIINRDLTVQEVFEPQIQSTYFICPTGVESERTVTLDPGSFGTYTWTLPDGSTSNSRTIIANEPGEYRVLLTASGCEFDIRTTVLEDCQPKVFAPDAIKPNSSIAQNRTFSVFANDYVGDFQIIIFNRWGTIVYESNNKNFEWDATDLGGVPVPPGLYAYIINFRSTDANGRTYEQRGGVNVVR